MSLTDERVVVVGGTSGMGLGTARLAAELGAGVVAAGRRPLVEREPLEGVTHARVDTTDEASVQTLFDEVGELDHLFVSSSPGSPGPLLEQDLTSARSFIDGKLLGSWMCARYAAPRVRAGGSRDRLRGASPAAQRGDGGGRIRRGRGAVPRARARARPARGERDPTWLHRQ